MKLVLILSFLMSYAAFGQDTTSRIMTAQPAPSSKIQCCLHQANKVCQIKFVTGACNGNWQPVSNIKKCLAAVPGYDFTQPLVGQINMNSAYVINPCL